MDEKSNSCIRFGLLRSERRFVTTSKSFLKNDLYKLIGTVITVNYCEFELQKEKTSS
jgi:hypothetical protein